MSEEIGAPGPAGAEEPTMGFSAWMRYGMEQGWCGPPVCYTHDGLPMSPAEEEEFEEHDPCVHIVRLYEDAEHAEAVKDNHSPTSWRNHYTT